MTKLARALTLLALVGSLATSNITTAQDKKADDKKKPAATEKKTEKKVEKAAGSIEVYQGKNGWRYIIKNADGKSIAMPLAQMSWESKEDCLKAIEELKAILDSVKPIERKE